MLLCQDIVNLLMLIIFWLVRFVVNSLAPQKHVVRHFVNHAVVLVDGRADQERKDDLVLLEQAIANVHINVPGEFFDKLRYYLIHVRGHIQFTHYRLVNLILRLLNIVINQILRHSGLI